MIPTLNAMYTSMKPFVKNLNLWQLDGRPISGDIGVGATRAAIMLAQKVVSSSERPPGFIQLAGGTNAHTATALKNVGLQRWITYENHGVSQQYEDNQSRSAVIAGVYARKVHKPCISSVHTEDMHGRLSFPSAHDELPDIEFCGGLRVDVESSLNPDKND
ncbi:hypothetical protein AXG93_246s1160 [Marchantia polymorpha subsp. ruderalis]|uniref:Iron-sulphur binding protein LdpA C-terminal domain-containing protein n=3 Tax=Marchantia polymorpha TaxID=3197 RepID=A0A176WD12_MARPO|nr:hypothetical protein AXG93_246s1160 [Marchantia polymorpha subsp. ruderalis]